MKTMLSAVITAYMVISIAQLSTCSCCCGEGKQIFDVDLTTGNHSIAPQSGISWRLQPQRPSNFNSSQCDVQGVLRINFPRAYSQEQRCRLQFDLYLDSAHTGWNFNIGNSILVNGYGGSSAELHNINDTWFLYTSVLPGHTDYAVDGANVERSSNHISNHVTVTIGDELVVFDNNRGIQKTYRSEYLFTLSGQQPGYGYDVYFGMNRVVNFHFGPRIGTGLCRAVIKAIEC